jgi:hypothetical protein
VSSTTRALSIIATASAVVAFAAFGFIWGVIVGHAVDVDAASSVQMAGGVVIVFGLLAILATILHSGAKYRDRGLAFRWAPPPTGLEVITLREPTE